MFQPRFHLDALHGRLGVYHCLLPFCIPLQVGELSGLQNQQGLECPRPHLGILLHLLELGEAVQHGIGKFLREVAAKRNLSFPLLHDLAPGLSGLHQ